MPDECIQDSSETLLLSPELTPSSTSTTKDGSGSNKTMQPRKFYKDHQQQQQQYQQYQSQLNQHEQQLKDADNLPAFSRIFVVCNKTTTEEELLQLFSVYGTIENCRLLRDRDTQSSKGLCYIKYSLASSAAKAIEQLNGKHICEHLPPLKVQIAEAKGSRKAPRKQYSDEPEDTPARSRLFVVCPRDLTEHQLNKEFSRFGDLEYCKVMTDRHSTESKGYSYVKFKLASTAALAMEAINEVGRLDGRKVKVLIADPKAKRSIEESPYFIPSIDETMVQHHHHHSAATGLFNYPLYVYPGGVAYPPPPGSAYGVPDMSGGVAQYYMPSPPQPPSSATAPPTRNLLYLVCSKRTTQEQLDYLFSSFVEFDYCELKYDKVTGESTGCAYVNFFTPQAAAYAIDSLDGTEYPAGSLMKLVWAEPSTVYEMPPMIDAYSPPPPGTYMSPYQMPYYPTALLPYPYAPGLVSPSAMPLPPPYVASTMKGMMQPPPPLMSLPPSIHPQATTLSTLAAAAAAAAGVGGNTTTSSTTWIDPTHSNNATVAMGTRLNFSLDVTLDRSILLDIFSRFGKIKALELESERVGYVQFTTPDEATLTLTQLAEVQVNGETVAMQLSAHQAVSVIDEVQSTTPPPPTTTTTKTTTDDAVVPPPGTVICEPVA